MLNILKIRANKPIIHPFYPKRDLQKDANFRVYQSYLNEAFKDSNIKNLALTGNFGVGKSSILYSYDIICSSRFYKLKKRSKFLYISLSDFAKTEAVPNRNNKRVKNKLNEINSLEINLINQILARCKEKDIPESSCKKYKEKKHFSKFYSFIIGSIIAILLSLIFKKEFQTVLTEIFSIVEGKITSIYAYLYLIFGLLVVILTFLVSNKVIHKLELRSINIKTSHADVDVGLNKYDTYIDCNKVEIVYVLSQIAKKINYTVVFEDMDRLDNKMCLEIFSKLREINFLVNIRLNNRRKSVRFVYVINDRLFDIENSTKFFDYILPILPSVNKFNSEKILRLSLEGVGIYNINHEFITKVSEVLYDYRKINSVINEYQLFRDIKFNKNFSNNYYMDIDDCEILAFVIYKTLCPQDYFNLRSGESELLNSLISNSCDIKKEKYLYLIKDLVQSGFITKRALELLGNSDDYIKKCYMKKLKCKIDSEKISAIMYLLKEEIVSKELKKLFNQNYFWNQNNLEYQALILCYLVIYKIDSCAWFFETSKSSNYDKYKKAFSILLNVPNAYLYELIALQGHEIKILVKNCLKMIVSHETDNMPTTGILWKKISLFLGDNPNLEMAVANHPIIVDGIKKTINEELSN
ncbi:MAG: hypothetical protein IKJ27_10535 [Clostridia bacterium]|nr:hypothetical protein [Clostridia bacterium]